MATIPVKHKRSATPGKIPTTEQLPLGQIAINTFDGKAYLKKDDGTESIVELGSSGGYTAPKSIALYDKDGSGSAASFDGVETTFQIRDSNNGIPAILSALSLAISLNGVVQKPNEGTPAGAFEGFYITANSTAGSDIVFSEAPATGADFFGVLGGTFAATGGTSAITYIDDISASFDGIETDFALQVNGSNYAPDYSVGVLVTLGGVVQIPTDSYSISGSTISFTQAPPTGTSFHAVDFRLGPSADMAAAIITASDTPPEDPADGQLWYDGVGGRVYLWYNNGTSSQWVDAAPATIGGTIELDGGNGASPSLTFAADTDTGVYSATANTLGFATGGSGRMVIDPNGRIGIGNASPDTIVHITDGASPKLQVEDTTNNVKTSISSDDTVGRIGTDTNHPLTFRVNDTEYLRVNTNGDITTNSKLGIGTGTPGVPLVVAKDGTTGPAGITGTAAVSSFSNTAQNRGLSINYDDTNVTAGIYPLGTNSKLCFYTPTASTYAERMRIDNQGRVGIGTNAPTNLLHVSGATNTVAQFASTSENDVYLRFANTTNSTGYIGYVDANLTFWVNNQERFRCDSSGRLLVGTSSASISDKFIVYGNANNNDEAFATLSRGSAPADGQNLGVLAFSQNIDRIGARILAQRDGGTWTGGSSHPGRLEISTRGEGRSSGTEH